MFWFDWPAGLIGCWFNLLMLVVCLFVLCNCCWFVGCYLALVFVMFWFDDCGCLLFYCLCLLVLWFWVFICEFLFCLDFVALLFVLNVVVVCWLLLAVYCFLCGSVCLCDSVVC